MHRCLLPIVPTDFKMYDIIKYTGYATSIIVAIIVDLIFFSVFQPTPTLYGQAVTHSTKHIICREV